MDLDSINLDSENLEDILSSFKSCVSVSVDKHAPKKWSKILFRDSWPWFNQELQDLERLVHNRERIWCSYKQDHHWCAYKEHHRKYTKLLRITRLLYTWAEIAKFKGNPKHLYKLTVELTGPKMENPLPEEVSEGNLAECFVEFFITKIDKLETIQSHPLYNQIDNCATEK